MKKLGEWSEGLLSVQDPIQSIFLGKCWLCLVPLIVVCFLVIHVPFARSLPLSPCLFTCSLITCIKLYVLSCSCRRRKHEEGCTLHCGWVGRTWWTLEKHFNDHKWADYFFIGWCGNCCPFRKKRNMRWFIVNTDDTQHPQQRVSIYYELWGGIKGTGWRENPKITYK